MKRKGTRHYAMEEWVDFATEQVTLEQKSAMQNHLEEGCEKCSQMESLWSRVNRVANRQPLVEPPASVVRHLERAFKLLSRAGQRKNGWLIPRLTFDSQWQPVTAGVRSVGRSGQHVIFAAGEIKVDMHMEPEPRSERVLLAGQIINVRKNAQELPQLPVVVSSEAGKVASVMTNRHGEFQVAFVPEPGLQVSFAIPGQRIFVVPLESSRVS